MRQGMAERLALAGRHEHLLVAAAGTSANTISRAKHFRLRTTCLDLSTLASGRWVDRHAASSKHAGDAEARVHHLNVFGLRVRAHTFEGAHQSKAEGVIKLPFRRFVRRLRSLG